LAEDFKYLAIKNWEIYQPNSKRSYPWIRDYKDKDFDRDISKLTVFQRGILDMCCRLRGRLAKNLSNDPQWIVGAVSIMPQERRNAVSAIGQLIAKGFLVLTNEQDSFVSLEGKKEKEIREEEKEIKPSAQKPRRLKSPKDVLPVDSRHVRIKSLICNAYEQENKIDCPWDGGEGKQLQALLKATPNWVDSQIAQCLVNMYGSAGFAKGTRPREFLPRLPRYLNGPLNEFNREAGNGNSKGERRAADISETTREVFGGSGSTSGDAPTSLQNQAASAGVGAVAGNTQRLQLRGIQPGDEPPHFKSPKVPT